MRQQFISSPARQSITLFVFLGGVFILCAVLFRPVLIPLIASFILYSILEPLSSRLVSRGFTQSTAINTVLAGLVSVIIASIVLVIPLVFAQMDRLQEQLPAILSEISSFGKNIDSLLSQKLGLHMDTGRITDQWLEKIQTWGASAVLTSAGFIMQVAMTLFLIPMITFFLLRDYRTVRNRVFNWLPNNTFELSWLIYYRVTKQLQRYLRGVLIQSGIIALISSLGFILLGLDMAILFGCLAGLLNLIPYIGPLLAMVPPVFLILGSGSLDVWLVIGVISVVLAAQIVDNLIVIPTIIANTVDLHPLVVLLGVIVFGYMFGFIGMLVAIPLLSTAKIILSGLLYGLRGKESMQFTYHS